MRANRIARLAACACAALLASGAWAQQYVYPAKGQSPDQQKKDESACYQWAVQQTGIDPSKPVAARAAATHDRDGNDAGSGCARRRPRRDRR